MSSRRRTGKPRSEQVLWAPGAVWSASQLRAARVLLPLQAKDARDQVDCPGDCARVFDKILEALVFELHTKLYPLLRCLAGVPVTRQVLAVTGIGHLLSDASLWSKSTEPRATIFARVLKQKWISEVRNSAKLFDVHAISTSSLNGFKNEPFLDSINSWAVEHEQFEKPPLDRHLRIRLGMVLALHGFFSISHLDGLEDVDIDCITSAPIFKSLLKRLRSATLPSPQVNPQSSSQSSFSTVSPRSAAMVADGISRDVVQELEFHVKAELDSIGLTDFDTTAKPMAVIQRLSRAKSCGVNVQSIVQERTKLLELESVRASLPSVASALKAWHAFATGVLGVKSDSTLPPVSEGHVCTFASVFRSPKTAANYISYLRWTCVHLRISTKWHGPEIKQIVTGIRKRNLRFTGGPSRTEFLLTSAVVHKVVSTADALRV